MSIKKKINIIDVFVLTIILLAILVGGYVFVRMNNSKQLVSDNDASHQGDTMYVTVVGTNAIKEIGENFKVGANLVVGNILLTGEEIVSVNISPDKRYTHTSEGEIILFDHPYLKEIEVVVKKKQNPGATELKINGQESRVGNMIFIKTQMSLLSGRITSIEFKD